MNNNQINCKAIYDRVKKAIKADIEMLGITPVFYILRGEENYASDIYMNLKVKTAKECGIRAYIKNISTDSNKEERKKIGAYPTRSERDKVRAFNAGYVNDGIGILQLPATKEQIEEFRWRFRDVDNLDEELFRFINAGDYNERKLPATARAALEILKQELGELSGKRIAVVGCRSKTVGRYMHGILLKENATVLLYHSKSKIEDGEFEKCDAVISCVGVGGLISQRHFGNKKGCVCIDIGVSRGEDGKVCGDFDKDIREHQRFTPYTNGVGLLTRIFLMASVVGAYFRGKIYVTTENGIEEL